jgi:hypothetical protein
MTIFFVLVSPLPFKWILPFTIDASECGDSITGSANKKRQQLLLGIIHNTNKIKTNLLEFGSNSTDNKQRDTNSNSRNRNY